MRRLKLRLNIPDDGGGGIGDLFKAFFKEYAQENELRIENKKLFLRFSFEELPEEVINAVAALPFSCIEELRIVEMESEESSQHVSNDEKEFTKMAKEESKPEELQKAENEELAAEEKKDSQASVIQNKEKRPHMGKLDENGKKFLRAIAKQSNSFEDFISKCESVFQISPKYQDFFKSMLLAACQLNSSNMTKIREEMEKVKVYDDHQFLYAKNYCARRIMEAFEAQGSFVKLKSFMEGVLKYQNYNFQKQEFPVDPKAKPECQIIEDELVEKLFQEPFFQYKVETIMDAICDKVTMDVATYTKSRGAFHHIVTSVAEDTKNGDFGKSLREKFMEVFHDNAHIATAFFYQLLKAYCQVVDYKGDDYVKVFFEDLRKLM